MTSRPTNETEPSGLNRPRKGVPAQLGVYPRDEAESIAASNVYERLDTSPARHYVVAEESLVEFSPEHQSEIGPTVRTVVNALGAVFAAGHNKLEIRDVALSGGKAQSWVWGDRAMIKLDVRAHLNDDMPSFIEPEHLGQIAHSLTSRIMLGVRKTLEGHALAGQSVTERAREAHGLDAIQPERRNEYLEAVRRVAVALPVDQRRAFIMGWIGELLQTGHEQWGQRQPNRLQELKSWIRTTSVYAMLPS